MKKLFSLFVLSFAAAPLLAAASTCETRVDKHPGATTAERVKYCLTEEPQTDEADVTEVVVSDVYSVQYPKPKTKQAAVQQEVSKIYTKEPVSMEYLDKDYYPAFRNDIMPLFSSEDAHAAAREVLATASVSQGNTGTKSLKKPAREMKTHPEIAAVAADTASYTQAYPSYQAAPVYQEPAYQAPAANAGTVPAYQAVQTSPAQLQQAQAIENDPQHPAYNAAGAPAGFDGNVLDQSNFGYNATDPAFQP